MNAKFVAEQMRLAGCSDEQIGKVAVAIMLKPQSGNAKRQARFRARRKDDESVTVTRYDNAGNNAENNAPAVTSSRAPAFFMGEEVKKEERKEERKKELAIQEDCSSNETPSVENDQHSSNDLFPQFEKKNAERRALRRGSNCKPSASSGTRWRLVTDWRASISSNRARRARSPRWRGSPIFGTIIHKPPRNFWSASADPPSLPAEKRTFGLHSTA